VPISDEISNAGRPAVSTFTPMSLGSKPLAHNRYRHARRVQHLYRGEKNSSFQPRALSNMKKPSRSNRSNRGKVVNIIVKEDPKGVAADNHSA
jgi:hypothetical protein